MNYGLIKSPITNKYYDVTSLTGRYVLQNYVNQLGGAKSCSSLKMKDCRAHNDCDWRKNAKGRNTCQKQMTLPQKRREAQHTLGLQAPKSPAKKSPAKKSPAKKSTANK